jgi:hypothetical protein
MRSNLGSSNKIFENEPQVKAVVQMFFKPFIAQVLRQFSKQLGYCSPSVKVTLAPHRAASTPGKAVPDPSYINIKYMLTVAQTMPMDNLKWVLGNRDFIFLSLRFDHVVISNYSNL